jgi:hypothetical protein
MIRAYERRFRLEHRSHRVNSQDCRRRQFAVWATAAAAPGTRLAETDLTYGCATGAVCRSTDGLLAVDVFRPSSAPASAPACARCITPRQVLRTAAHCGCGDSLWAPMRVHPHGRCLTRGMRSRAGRWGWASRGTHGASVLLLAADAGSSADHATEAFVNVSCVGRRLFAPSPKARHQAGQMTALRVRTGDMSPEKRRGAEHFDDGCRKTTGRLRTAASYMNMAFGTLSQVAEVVRSGPPFLALTLHDRTYFCKR